MSENSFRSIESAALTGVETTPPLPARTVSHPPDNGAERSPGLFDISDARSRVVVCNRKPPSVLKELGARHGADHVYFVQHIRRRHILCQNCGGC